VDRIFAATEQSIAILMLEEVDGRMRSQERNKCYPRNPGILLAPSF
jgi:hypothetical protein